MPLTHGIDAARQVAAGAPLGDVTHPLATELAVGAAYFTVGLLLLRIFEHHGRTAGSLDRF